jgi:hypothetical protein
MKDARRGRFDAVIVWRFDRFGRSVKQLVLALQEFRALEVGFISLSESIDTTTPMGKMIFAVTAAFSEFLLDITRENVCAGLDRARKEGKHIGRLMMFRPRSLSNVGAGGTSLGFIPQEVPGVDHLVLPLYIFDPGLPGSGVVNPGFVVFELEIRDSGSIGAVRVARDVPFTGGILPKRLSGSGISRQQ